MDNKTTQHALDAVLSVLAPLRAFMQDPTVQEIMVNAPDDVWVERAGVQAPEKVSISNQTIETALTILARLGDIDVKAGSEDGLINARLPGFRFAGVLAPTSIRGNSLTIRKHNPLLLRLHDYVSKGELDEKWRKKFIEIVTTQRNILVVGGTSSGKTTFTNALIAEISHAERVLTIEDIEELKVSVPNYVSWLANPQRNVTIKKLVKHALRFAPKRILVGEVRGAEAYDLLEASNTGHDGVIATLHANSAFDALSRFETMVLQAGIDWPHAAICTQIARTFHYVIFMVKKNGRRQLGEFLQLTGYDRVTAEYKFEMLYQQDHSIGATNALSPV